MIEEQLDMLSKAIINKIYRSSVSNLFLLPLDAQFAIYKVIFEFSDTWRGTKGACVEACDRLYDALNRLYPAGEIEIHQTFCHVQYSTTHQPKIMITEQGPIYIGFSHRLILFRGYYIDLTARQFNYNLPCPYIIDSKVDDGGHFFEHNKYNCKTVKREYHLITHKVN